MLCQNSYQIAVKVISYFQCLLEVVFYYIFNWISMTYDHTLGRPVCNIGPLLTKIFALSTLYSTHYHICIFFCVYSSVFILLCLFFCVYSSSSKPISVPISRTSSSSSKSNFNSSLASVPIDTRADSATGIKASR